MKFLVVLLLSVSANLYAQQGVSVQFDPYTFIHVGDYEVDGNIDSGSYSGFGLGVRIGASTPWLWLGLDGNVTKPSFKSDGLTAGNDRNDHPLADGQNFVSLGAGLAIKLGSLVRLTYTYFLDQNLSVDISSGSDSGEYKYHGTGYKAGIDFQLAEGFHLFAEKFVSSMDQYELSRNVGSQLATGGKANRQAFEIDAYSIGIGFKLAFGSLGSFR